MEKPQKMMGGKPFIASGLWTSADISAGSVVINHSEKRLSRFIVLRRGFFSIHSRIRGAVRASTLIAASSD